MMSPETANTEKTGRCDWRLKGHLRRSDEIPTPESEALVRFVTNPASAAADLIAPDGDYTTPTLWLMDGFAAVGNEGWQAPGHWRQVDGEWQVMTFGGLKPVDLDAPVCHISYYEADAFARWSGKHLPTEME
jgi:hypothetical protein